MGTWRYVTKYWKTEGITHEQGELMSDGYFYYMHGHTRLQVFPKDNHGSFEEALARAKQQQKNKLRSLKREIEKVRGLVFRDPLDD